MVHNLHNYKFELICIKVVRAVVKSIEIEKIYFTKFKIYNINIFWR